MTQAPDVIPECVAFHFDDFVVDPVAFRLRKAGQPVAIEPKALQVLIALIERRDRPVAKQELLDEVWAEVVVTENSLTRAVAQLRKTLGDSAESPHYIETVPTRGYRFVAQLRTDEASASARPRRSGRKAAAILIVVVVAVIVVGLSLRQLVRRETRQVERDIPPPITARPLHSAHVLEISPSFSPDGTLIVYGADVNGTLHLFVSTTDGHSPRQLTDGEAGEAQPSWSPDGKTIAYTSVRRGGIWLIEANGGTPALLTKFGSRPSWSPDGTEVAFQSDDDVEYGWNAYEALPPSRIFIVNVASRTVVPLTAPGHPVGGHGAPSWRRDGKRIAFSSCDHEHCGIFTIARDGSGLTRLMTDPRRLASPLFSADGSRVYFVLSLYNQSQIIAVSVDPDGSAIGDPRPLRESNPGVIQHVSLSLDGSRFAWSVVEEKSDLFVVDVGSHLPPRQVTSHSTMSATFPAFSPDGESIAYSLVAAGNESGIWVTDVNGKESKALTIGAGLKQYVRWKKRDWGIFYSAWSVGDHRPVLYRVAPAGGAPVVAGTLPEDASAPAISPDLRTIAFNRTIDGVVSVWVSAADGSALRRWSDDADLARFPVWSPSGKSLAVQLRRGGSSIAVLPGRKILMTGGENWPHSWSGDEREIAFAGRRDGVWNVWSVNASTGQTRKLTDFTSTTNWVRTPSWSPDGKRIVFEAGAPRGNLWVSDPRVGAW